MYRSLWLRRFENLLRKNLQRNRRNHKVLRYLQHMHLKEMAKVLDFGIAKFLLSDTHQATADTTGRRKQ
jgi:hypothetical protein